MSSILESGRSLDAISPATPLVVADNYQSFALNSRIGEIGRSFSSITPQTPRQSGLIGLQAPALPPAITTATPYLSIPGSGCGETYDYGTTSVGYPISHTFTLINSGAAELDITSFTLTGAGYTLITPPPSIINPGQLVTFVVRLNATSVAAPSGAITIVNNTTQSPCIVSLTGNVIGPHVTFSTYLGRFIWYGFLPYDNVNDGSIPERYSTTRVYGFNNLLEYVSDTNSAQIGNGVTNLVDSPSNALLIDPITGVHSGILSMTTSLKGTICAGSSFAYVDGTVGMGITTTGFNIMTLVQGSYVFVNSFSSGHLTRGYAGYPIQAPGYMATYCGNGISGGGSLNEYLSSRVTIAQAALAGGAVVIQPQPSSITSSYDPSSGIANGQSTAMNITYPIPSVSGNFIVTSNFLITPIGGGPATTTSITQIVAVGIGGTLNIEQDIPMKNGYVVTYTGGTIDDFFDCGDDFEAQLPVWYGANATNYVIQPSWPTYGPIFGMALPGTECASDWDNATPGPYILDASDYYWAGPGTLQIFDNTEGSDDFENYPVGSIPVLYKGTGWVSVGFFGVFDNQPCFDDFESYAVGLLYVLNYQTANLPINFWNLDGICSTFDNLLASDDFESYATGTITILNGGSGWAANGSFASFP